MNMCNRFDNKISAVIPVIKTSLCNLSNMCLYFWNILYVKTLPQIRRRPFFSFFLISQLLTIKNFAGNIFSGIFNSDGPVSTVTRPWNSDSFRSGQVIYFFPKSVDCL